MNTPKCKVCNKKWDWFYETKNNCDFYCEEHLPCGKFKRFMGKYVVPIIRQLSQNNVF